MYKLANDKNKTGYKGVRLSNDNLNSFPERLLNIWLKAGIIKKIKSSTKKEVKNDTKESSKTNS